MSRGQREDNAVFEAEGTDTWTPAFVVFSYTEHDDDALAVRVDTFIGARFARTTFVPNDTTRVTIVRTYDASENPERTEATVTDPRQIAGLVALVNNLPGSMTGEFVASCPASLFEIDYRVRFDSPQSTSVLRFQPACWAQATLRTDGTDTEPTLDPGPRFTKALDLHLG